MRQALLWTLSLLTTSGCAALETIDHSETGPGLPASQALEMAAELVIDGSVHVGEYQDGTKYEGIYGETARFRLSALGPGAPVALAHASSLASRIGLRLSPHDLITHIALQGGVGCVQEAPRGGCFRLLRDPHLRELQELRPERFGGVDEGALTRGGVGLGAMVYVWRVSFAHAIFGQYEEDVEAYMGARSSALEEAQYGFFAHIYSPYAPVLEDVFGGCRERELRACVDASARKQPGQADILNAHANISEALAKAPRAPGGWTKEQVEAYLQELSPMYPDLSFEAEVEEAFGAMDRLGPMEQEALLEALTRAIEAPPSPVEIRRELCGRGVLMGSPGCG